MGGPDDRYSFGLFIVFDWEDKDDTAVSRDMHASFGGTEYSKRWANFGKRILVR